jgi:uncharacterized protein (TIGR03437 family)
VEGGGSLLLKFTIGDPPAAIRNVGPLPFIQGGPGFVMTVIGTRFAQGAVVQWNGTNLATAFQYNTQLAANVPASLLATAGEVRLRVVNPDGGASPEFTAEVQERFAIEGINPQTVFAGSDAFLLTVTGSGFKTGAAILLNGSQAPVTGYSSSHSLSARVEAPMLKGPGSVRVAVRNPDGALTQELRLIVEDTRPTITELIPSSAVAGSQPLTLTIMGRKFSPGASVSWGLYSLTTKFVDSTTLTATVPAAFLAAPSETGIAAVNPNGEGSSPAIFTVRNFVVTGILPSSVRAGSSDFTLTVTGEGFLGGSVLQWNSTRLVTTWRDERRLEAIVPAALIASPGAAAVSVLPAAGQASNAITFSIEVATPSISRLSPASIDAGSPGFTLGIDGADFARGATIWWQSTALATSWESPSRLTGSVPAALIASSGSIEIKACNTSTNCSSAAVFTVTEPGAPTFTSVMPSSVTAGAPSVLLTLAGSRFTPGSTVRWNGSPLQTAFVNSAQLVAVADASLIASPGTASIAVVNPGGVTSAALTFTIKPPIPTYSAAGIVNAASSGALIAPGSLISIYGFNLATSTSVAASVPLPGTLAGTSVTLNGVQAPLLYVSPLQINAQAPFEIAPGKATIVIESNGRRGLPVEVDFVETAPGIFAKDDHILAFSYPDGVLNTPDSPAPPRQYMTAYLTGQGLVDNPVATGEPAPVDGRLSRPLAKVEVKIGGQPVEVPFLGLAPGFVGVAQINFVVPNVPAGDHPFEVTIGGKTGLPAVISVKPAETAAP